MPPKRKLARTSNVDNSTESTPVPPSGSPSQIETKTSTQTSIESNGPSNIDILADPWTDEQEIALLKAIVRWKPVGMHKHFRMIAIKNYMDSQPSVNPERDTHCNIPGIWEKLGQWYNLSVLDEREDSFLASPPQSPKPDVKPKSLKSSSTFQPFSLPPEFHDMMFERRLAPEGSKSPPLSAVSIKSGRSGRGSTVRDSEEPRSSPLGGGSGRNRRGGRSMRATAAGRAAAAATKKEAEAEADDEEGEEDVEEEGSGEESGEEEEGSEEEGSEEEDEATEDQEDRDDTPRAKKARSGNAGTPSRGRTAAARARGRSRVRGRRN